MQQWKGVVFIKMRKIFGFKGFKKAVPSKKISRKLKKFPRKPPWFKRKFKKKKEDIYDVPEVYYDLEKENDISKPRWMNSHLTGFSTSRYKYYLFVFVLVRTHSFGKPIEKWQPSYYCIAERGDTFAPNEFNKYKFELVEKTKNRIFTFNYVLDIKIIGVFRTSKPVIE